MIGTTSDPVAGRFSLTVTVPEEPVYTPSPGYSAITTPVSPARITSGIDSVAVEIEPLAVSAALPSANWSSINVTVPVGATVPPPDTVAVSVTVLLRSASVGLAARVVELAVPLLHSVTRLFASIEPRPVGRPEIGRASWGG